MVTTKNIFVSHACDDDKLLFDIKGLFSRMGMAVDSSEPNEANSKERIEQKIEWASVVVVLITEGAKKCKWISWEIEYAIKQGKRVIGVSAQGITNDCIPDALDDLGDAVIAGCQEQKIIDAIEGESNWEDLVTGEKRIPKHPPVRYSC